MTCSSATDPAFRKMCGPTIFQNRKPEKLAILKQSMSARQQDKGARIK